MKQSEESGMHRVFPSHRRRHHRIPCLSNQSRRDRPPPRVRLRLVGERTFPVHIPARNRCRILMQVLEPLINHLLRLMSLVVFGRRRDPGLGLGLGLGVKRSFPFLSLSSPSEILPSRETPKATTNATKTTSPNRNWPTAEDEKQKLFNRARQRADEMQELAAKVQAAKVISSPPLPPLSSDVFDILGSKSNYYATNNSPITPCSTTTKGCVESLSYTSASATTTATTDQDGNVADIDALANC